jgi:uncharacterized protein (TIGR03435 family)
MTRRQKPYGTNIGTGKWILGLSAVLLAICVMPVHSNATQARSSGAQAATAPSEFDVTSVKPRTGAPVIGGASAGTRFHRPDITLRQLIVFAYDLPPFRVVGGPDWVASDRWDVDARVAMPASREQMRLLVQRLLADRFGLEARLEGRDLPVLLVQLVNSDGRLGKQLRRSSLDCTSRSATDQDAGSVDGNGFPLCAAMTARQTTTSRTVTIRGNPLSVILRRLEVSVGQPLIDRTERQLRRRTDVCTAAACGGGGVGGGTRDSHGLPRTARASPRAGPGSGGGARDRGRRAPARGLSRRSGARHVAGAQARLFVISASRSTET